MEQACAYVFDPAYLMEENTNVRGRGGKDSITQPHPRCSSFWQVAGMQRCSSLLGLQDLRALAREEKGIYLPRSSEASYSSAKHSCFNSFYVYHGCPCFPALYLFLATEITARTRARNSSCKLFSAHQLQPPITASEARG